MKGMDLRVRRFSVSWPHVSRDGRREINQLGLGFHGRLRREDVPHQPFTLDRSRRTRVLTLLDRMC